MARKEIDVSQLNIYQKLAIIRKQVEVIRPDKAGFNYKYVGEDTIMAKLTGLMDKYHLSLVPNIVPVSAKVIPYSTKKTKATKDGKIYEENVNEVLVSADMVFTWLDTDNPAERIEVPWFMVGHQDDASQSFGSGLSYSMRYFLLKFFGIATPNDDPDNWRSKQQETLAEEDKLVAKQIIGEFDTMVRKFLAANAGKAEEVKKFVSQYVKNGNYLNITESILAAKLMSEFKQNFQIEE